MGDLDVTTALLFCSKNLVRVSKGVSKVISVNFLLTLNRYMASSAGSESLQRLDPILAKSPPSVTRPTTCRESEADVTGN